MIGTNVSSYPDDPSDMLMTSAGRPAGSPFASKGSIAHCMPARIFARLPPPLPLSTLAAMSWAWGATPIRVPDSAPPTTVPATCVPCEPGSLGREAIGFPARSKLIQLPG